MGTWLSALGVGLTLEPAEYMRRLLFREAHGSAYFLARASS